MSLEPSVRKAVLRKLTYGIYILTSYLDDQPVAATVTWVMQVSFEPLLVAVCLRHKSRIESAVRQTGRFGLNLLAKGQADLAADFFQAPKADASEIGGHRYHRGDLGMPVLDAAPAYLEATVQQTHHPGDHAVIVSNVQHVGIASPDFSALALSSTSWHYGG